MCQRQFAQPGELALGELAGGGNAFFGEIGVIARAGQIIPSLAVADSQRIERALEVWQLTGRPLSAHFAEHTPHTAPLDLCTLALIPVDRTLLHAQIAKRFHAMLAQGFLDEVQQLQAAYPALSADMPSMRWLSAGFRRAAVAGSISCKRA